VNPLNGLKKMAWPFMLITTLVMTILFISGFARVISITGSSEIAGTSTNGQGVEISSQVDKEVEGVSGNEDAKNVILIIGDSIGAGVGDERNLGIGGRLLSLMTFEEADTYEVVNMSVPGATTSEMKANLLSGNFDKAIKEAKYVFVSIGGNNLNRMRGTEVSLKVIELEERLSEHINDLEDSLTYLREANEEVEIVVLGLYNPYGDSSETEDVRFLHEWNYQTRLVLLEFDQIHFIALYDVFKVNLNLFLSIDDFHPSGEGYQKIAEYIKEVLVSL